jgi:hypothetical protein
LDALAEIDQVELTQDDINEIDRIVADMVTDPVGPEFMAPPADRRGRPQVTARRSPQPASR